MTPGIELPRERYRRRLRRHALDRLRERAFGNAGWSTLDRLEAQVRHGLAVWQADCLEPGRQLYRVDLAEAPGGHAWVVFDGLFDSIATVVSARQAMQLRMRLEVLKKGAA